MDPRSEIAREDGAIDHHTTTAADCDTVVVVREESRALDAGGESGRIDDGVDSAGLRRPIGQTKIRAEVTRSREKRLKWMTENAPRAGSWYSLIADPILWHRLV